MGHSDTFWFTIAAGSRYREMAEDLARSLEKHHIPLVIMGNGSMTRQEAKHLKIDGILESPASCRRIVYLDADALVLNPDGIDNVNGSWQIPWKMRPEDGIPKTLNAPEFIERLDSFFREKGVPVFARGQEYHGIEWNSGVIVGDRQILIELARSWAGWWKETNEFFGGHFRRDQISYRLAYYEVCRKKYGLAGIPPEFNWIVSYSGINPNANILHRTMVKRVEWMQRDWSRIVARTLAGEEPRTRNRVFDLAPVQDVKPCLDGCIHFDQAVVLESLRRIIVLENPEKILILGETESGRGLSSQLGSDSGRCFHSDSLENPREISGFDIIIFHFAQAGKVHDLLPWIDGRSVCCLTNAHDLEFYQLLFHFSFVRFINHSLVVFSNRRDVMNMDFHERTSSSGEIHYEQG